MNEEFKAILERHKKEIKDYQDNCPHHNKSIHEYIYGIGCEGGRMDICNDCGKILAHYMQEYKRVEKNGVIGSEKVGDEVRVETDKLDEWRKVNLMNRSWH